MSSGSPRIRILSVDDHPVVRQGIAGLVEVQPDMRSPADLTIVNSQYLADGSLDPARLTPKNAGFGAATGAQRMRNMQLQIRFMF